uniref:Tub domain-containing protein n=1 Tax=Haemonchus placei TaxID=6290 RepID=A0A0N4VZ56_HAEPC
MVSMIATHPGTSSAVTSVSSIQSSSTAVKTGQQRDSDDIKAHLDKLARIAGQLSHRHADFNPKRDRASINKMRSQMKELLRRVNEIEKKVGSGDVRGEVRQLMRTLEEMKCALGEGPAPKSTSATPILTMHNKTPFWNEHNQVYQLDFGGRVTQESAKNFQVTSFKSFSILIGCGAVESRWTPCGESDVAHEVMRQNESEAAQPVKCTGTKVTVESCQK